MCQWIRQRVYQSDSRAICVDPHAEAIEGGWIIGPLNLGTSLLQIPLNLVIAFLQFLEARLQASEERRVRIGNAAGELLMLNVPERELEFDARVTKSTAW